jgi:hypothetical protein
MLLGGVLHAEDASGLSLKIRAQAGTETTEGVRNGFGVGLNYGFKMGPGSLNAELSYQYYAGKQFRQAIGTNPFGLTETNAVDSRKSSVNGLGIRASYSMKFAGDWGWQIGAAFMQMKSREEAIGTFGSNTTTNNYGSWAMAPEKSGMTASPFVGLTYNLGEIGAIEFNLIAASYKQVTVSPTYNAGATGNVRVTPTIGDSSVNKLKLEVAYAFKF